MKKRVCLLITDGTGIRNYLYSDVLKYIYNAGNEVVIWHSLPDRVIKTAEDIHGISIEAYTFNSFSDPIVIRLYREASTYARLLLNSKMKNNPTILTNWNTKRNTWGKKMLYPLAELLGLTLKSYAEVEKLERKIFELQQKTLAFNIYREKLKAMNVDLLFCTHQRVPQNVPAVLAAESIGVKTTTAIFSWDNLPKARLPVRVSQYLVWSSYMKNELREYYPEISEDRLDITGTPQFDFYQNSNHFKSKEKFAREYGLDPNKHWVLFSGDDSLTSPYDADYLREVSYAMRNENDIEILFREVPVEGTDRYKQVLETCDKIQHIPPKWHKGKDWTTFTPTFDDFQLLGNLAKHCETVINVGSTMALDFVFFDHPALYINYDQPHAQNWSVNTIYQFEHFKTMNGLDAVGWINSKDEILKMIRKAIDSPDSIAVDRMKWQKRITGTHKRLASENIAYELLKNV